VIAFRVEIDGKVRAQRERPLCVIHLVDEVPDVSRVGHDGPDGVLGLRDDGPFVHPAHAGRLAADVLQGVGLLQLAQVVVLRARANRCTSATEVHTDIMRVCVCVCVRVWVGACLSASHLVFLSSSLFVVFEDVVSDVVFRVNEQLLVVPLLLTPLDPHHEQQHHAYTHTHTHTRTHAHTHTRTHTHTHTHEHTQLSALSKS